MAIVINVPRDERFGDIGKGIGVGVSKAIKSNRLKELLENQGITVPAGATPEDLLFANKLATAQNRNKIKGVVTDEKGDVTDVRLFTQQELDASPDVISFDAFKLGQGDKKTQVDRDRIDLISNNPHLAKLPAGKQRTVARNIQTEVDKANKAFDDSFSGQFVAPKERRFKSNAFDQEIRKAFLGDTENAPIFNVGDARKIAQERVNSQFDALKAKGEDVNPFAEDTDELDEGGIRKQEGERDFGADIDKGLDFIKELFTSKPEAAKSPLEQPAGTRNEAAIERANELGLIPPDPDTSVAIGQVGDDPILIPASILEEVRAGKLDILDAASYLERLYGIVQPVAVKQIQENINKR